MTDMQTRAERDARALERGDDHVNLGSAAEVEEGTELALRHLASREAGIPQAHLGGELPPEPATAEKLGVLARTAATIRGYIDLRRTPYGLGPALLMCGVVFFQVFDTQAFSVAGPEIVRDLEIRIADLTYIQQIIGVIGVFGAIGLGYFFDRHTRAKWIGIGTIFSGLTSMASAPAKTFASLATPRVADDVADLAASVPRFSLLSDYYPPEARGRVFSMYSTFSRVGRLLAIFLVGWVVTQWSWRVGAVVFAIPLTLMGVLTLIRLREPVRGYMERKALGAEDDIARTEDEPLSLGEGWRTVWSIRTLRRLFIADAITIAGDSVYLFYVGFYLAEEYGLNAFERSMIGLPSLIAALIGGFYGGGLIDRFTQRNPGRVLTVLGAFSLISAFGVLGLALGPPLAILILFNTIIAFGSALIGPASTVVYSQILPPVVRTQGLTMTGLAALPGFIIFTPLARTLFTEYGYTATFLFAVPLLVVGAIVAMSAGSFFDLDVRSAFAASLATDEWRRAKSAGRGKLLVCRDIDVEYSGVQVLFGVDFDVEEGQIIALLGTNGAGKSTLLKAISGTSEASGGAVVFDGRDITHMPSHEIASRGIAHMPGGRGIFPGLTVRDNLMLANWLTDDQDEVKTRLAEVFQIFPSLTQRLDTPAGALSGGEQQMLSLAQAFLAKPRLLMIDELSLGLSPAVVGQLLDIVREIHRRGVTIIVVEQSVQVALEIAEKAIFMEKGEVKFFGRTADLLDRPDILRAVYVKGSGALTDGVPAAARRRSQELAVARPILQVESLVKRYGGITAVDDVTFDLREGEVLGLIGPNGAGKTTIFDMISGFQPPDSGRIGLKGVEITNLPPEERASRGLVRRFQDARLFPSLTVYETLLVSLEQKLEVKSTFLNAFAMPSARRAERRLRDRAERLIELLELQSYRDKFVKELSTGLRRIVDLACVLAAEPQVLLLDEPSSGIAQAEAESLAPLLRRIRFETGCSILIIEHDMPLISAVSDELIALERGRVVVRDRPNVVLNDERVIEAYLGTTDAAVNRSRRT